MIDIINNKVNMSSELTDNVLTVKIEEHTLYFDNTDEFNQQFISHIKRGNGFKEDEIKEPSTTRALYNLSKKYKINNIYDIGCQNLYTTLQLSKLFNCEVIGFDIDQNAIAAGLKNLKLNKNVNIKIIDRGVGSKVNGDIVLDEMPSTDMIFIDIEGYQYYVFKEGLEFIEKNRPIIVYETDSKNASLFVKPDKQILKPLVNLNYAFYYCEDHRKNKPFRAIDCNNIPESDGLLLIIPKEKI